MNESRSLPRFTVNNTCNVEIDGFRLCLGAGWVPAGVSSSET
ncbi:hypothetical protein L810_6866 [Burkholderia sp. AU4i]|nr:hypothetical protein L810_6866 [Burkholderia sp. AU4i]